MHSLTENLQRLSDLFYAFFNWEFAEVENNYILCKSEVQSKVALCKSEVPPKKANFSFGGGGGKVALWKSEALPKNANFSFLGEGKVGIVPGCGNLAHFCTHSLIVVSSYDIIARNYSTFLQSL